MYVKQVRLSIWCVTRRMPAFLPASFRVLERKLLVLIAVPRADGKMKASGLASLAAERKNSSSVSMDAGSQTYESLVDTENPVQIENTGSRSLREIIIVSKMTPFFIALLALVASTFRTRAAQQAEIVALRHQIAATSSPPSAIGPPAVDCVFPFLAGLAALAAYPEAGHCGSLASEGICALLDPQIAPPSGKTRSRCCDSRFDSTNEPGQFLVGSASHSW